MANLTEFDVIIKPVLTEKSLNNMANKKYTFDVHPKATKVQIKQAVEKMFDGVKVENVNTLIRKPKVSVKFTKLGRIKGKTSTRKIAIVTLTAESKEIEIIAGM